jgi:hypothetical protein
MFEIEGHKSTIIGLALGGISGFIFHKNLKLSKGYGIAVGSVLGLIIGFQITKAQAKKIRELSDRVRNMEAIDQKNKMILEGKMTSTIDVNTIPNNFTIKSDGYNTRYFKGGGGVFNYWKTPYSLTGESGVQPISIEVDEFTKAYNKFLQQPK